ncbi:c-type cytochrome [Candidatus Nasuia deltocephalinicola]|uniref:c-type cytochrome n=1 Tax=Candidatus Nasuia deltocephalincola TaxID=1160784 RepID=UPI00216AECFC|nr:c-type cytochrome [Candidatus Nasuia deltocephalinicola]
MLIKIFAEILVIFLIKTIKKKKIKIKIKKNANINKGKYLVRLSNCLSCHTLEGGKPFSGGNIIKTDFGLLYTPNITFNKIYGIGKYNLKSFINLIKNGISKKKKFIFPAFPYINYNKMKKNDILNIFNFIKKIPKEEIISKNNKIKFPIKYKNVMMGWRILFFKKKNNINKEKSNIKRGKYISKTLGHCEMCHTRINKIGKINKYFKYKGYNKVEKWFTSDISNNKGVQKNNIKNIYKILKNGINKEKIINGKMLEVVNNSLQYASQIDLVSISRFIKSKINKKKILKINIKEYNKKEYKAKYKIGKKIYKKNCKKCHGKLKLGNFPIFPKIIKIKKNFIYESNLKNLFKKSNINNTIKNKYCSIMPSLWNIKNKIIIYFIKNKNLNKNFIFKK